MTQPERQITATRNVLAPSLDIHRNMRFKEKSTEIDPVFEITDYIDKRFCYSTVRLLLNKGYRVARPVGDDGYLLLTMSRDPKRVSSFETDGSKSRGSTRWNEENIHTAAHDWTLADYPFDISNRTPEYDNQPAVLQDFLYEHIEDPLERDLAFQYFKLACSIAYNNDEGHGKTICLDYLFNSKNAILHDMQKRRLGRMPEGG